MPLDTFGNRLEHARNQAGLSQAELARQLGIDIKAVRAYLTGKSKPLVHRLPKIAEVVGVSEAWLVTGKEADPEAPLYSEEEEDEQIHLAKLIYAKRHNVAVERVLIGAFL